MLTEYLPNDTVALLDVILELQIRISKMVDIAKQSREKDFLSAFEDFIFIRDTFWQTKSNFIRDGTLRAGIILLIKKISPILTTITILSESVQEREIEIDSIFQSLQKLLQDFNLIVDEVKSII